MGHCPGGRAALPSPLPLCLQLQLLENADALHDVPSPPNGAQVPLNHGMCSPGAYGRWPQALLSNALEEVTVLLIRVLLHRAFPRRPVQTSGS